MYFTDAEITKNFLKTAEVSAARKLAGQTGFIDSATERFTGTPEAKKAKGTLDWIKSLFDTPKTQVSSDALEAGYAKLVGLNEKLADTKKFGGSVNAVEAEIEALKGTLKGHAEELIPQFSAAKDAHINARDALRDAQTNARTAAREAYQVAAKPLKGAALVAEQTKLKDTLDMIDKKFAPHLETHNKFLEAANKWEAQIKDHGIADPEEIMKKLKGAAPEAVKDLAQASAKALTNAAGETISEGAAKLGVVGEEAMKAKTGVGGFFSKMAANAKANLNIAGDLTKNGAGQVIAKESGWVNKGIKVASTGAGVFLVGAGLKDLGQVVGVLSPDTDETGKEVPADSGKLIKSVAEVGAGAALAYFSLLKGGKAAGMVK